MSYDETLETLLNIAATTAEQKPAPKAGPVPRLEGEEVPDDDDSTGSK